jgi:GMP synthase-like glutamine amidotransferase
VRRVLVVENFTGTPLGGLAPVLAEARVATDLRRAWQGEPIPESAEGHDGLIVLGGAQSAVDDAEHPYLKPLAGLTGKFGAADKPVLGICLGAQLVARGHGATNILGRPIEFGWHTVAPTAAGRADPVIAAIGAGAPVFHWHLDTFTLPPGAVHLATSRQTELQAFRIGRATYGIQFHFEADRKLVDEWSTDFADVIAAHDPDWPARRPELARRHGAEADAAGAAIGRAWVGLLT